ncbi:MAG TPA: hypothetical protein VNV85_16625, partial [Puia sp.]|nr:hypothetical protein [Puia sp.]
MKRIMLFFLKRNAGKIKMQKLYETLFQLSLSGMNYGNGGDFKESGELNVLKLIKEKLIGEKALTIFDVGGNVGNYSKAICDFFDKDVATIHSFEPSKKTFEKFIKNTEGLANIIPNNFGFSDRESSLTLYTNSEASGLASVYQ